MPAVSGDELSGDDFVTRLCRNGGNGWKSTETIEEHDILLFYLKEEQRYRESFHGDISLVCIEIGWHLSDRELRSAGCGLRLSLPH